jgi:PncC family amidohydrolase
VLGVPRELIEATGAVSEEVAAALAQGAALRFDADLGVSVTGIAGPDGGSEQKPVGLTYVAVADGTGTEVRRYLWSGTRTETKRASAAALLGLVLERIDSRSDPA